MIDTHAHLGSLDGGPHAAIEEAAGAGVAQIICIGASPAEAREAIELAGSQPGIFATAGLHPHRASEWSGGVEAELDALCASPLVVAVGECGLDHFRDRSPRADQRRAFGAQLDLAGRHELPVIVHTRDAADETLELLAGFAGTAILHCFSLPDQLDAIVERGWYCSFAGNVTYPRATRLQDAARRVPEALLLLETDAPYLAPEPHRGRPNRPVHVLETLRFVAGLRGTDPAALAEAVQENAARAFSL